MRHIQATIPGDLPSLWRARAAFLEQYGDPASARLWRLAAAELEQAVQRLGEETLTLVQAAAVSGYTADHLGQLIRRGTIPNAGRQHAPRIRRGDLPMKSPDRPGRPPSVQSADVGKVTNITKLRTRR
jgi:hypothetical protein